jgi:hypothetical protein
MTNLKLIHVFFSFDERFDILVNGAAMVTLHLQRIPFHPVKRTVFVPANQILVLHSPIVMSVLNNAEEHSSLQTLPAASGYQSEAPAESAPHHFATLTESEDDLLKQPHLYKELLQYTHQSSLSTQRHSSNQQSHSLSSSKGNLSQFGSLHCWSHNYNHLRVRILRSNLLSNQQLYSLPKSAVLMDSGSLQEVISLPSSKLNLVYQSSSRLVFNFPKKNAFLIIFFNVFVLFYVFISGGFSMLVHIRLISGQPPESLRTVHLHLTIEGILQIIKLEPVKHLKYTFAWNRRNVYKQKVYGQTVLRGQYTHFKFVVCIINFTFFVIFLFQFTLVMSTRTVVI